MKMAVVLALGGLLAGPAVGQTPNAAAVLKQYRQALAGHVLGYEVQRIDTFPDGTVWNHRGRAVMRRRPAGSVLPADFWAQRPDLGLTYYYNGAAGYDLDDKARTYQLAAEPFAPSVLGSAAGQMLAEELLAAADSTYQSVEYYPTSQGGVLHFRYPDQPAVDVLNRHIYLVLDAQTGLPREVTAKATRGGGLWTITKRLSQLRLDDPADVAVLNQPAFLATYREAAPAPVAKTPSLLGQRAPAWALASLAGAPVRLASYKGRVVVLDFWETHCAPCIGAMPELQRLQARYGGQGVVVLGMLADDSPGAPSRARGILKRQGATYTNVLADAKIAAAYRVVGFPHQLVIGRTGRVEFDHEGGEADAALAVAVQKALQATAPAKAKK
jgi:thiol-disulfide isomerase/thioredoxin